LGMRKHEIDRKLDEIIDFSGIERYIDTPVKRYSSGMYVRLAFAVAAHLESEILIVDEVLAVGDAEFQKKCLGKMGEVNKGEGRTVLFVSHNISSILNLTNAAILLNNGKNQIFDSTQVVLDIYNKQLIPSELNVIEMRNFDNRISVDKILINGNVRNSVEVKNCENIEIIIDLNSTEQINLTVEARLFDLNSVPLALFSDGHYSGSILKIKDGKHKLKTIIELPDMINSGEILLEILLTDPGKTIYSKTEHNIKIKFDGVICQSGHKFQLNNAGFLLLKGNTNELC
jgi:lipopolysaccharide transport system ATP-binding protein